MVNANGNQCAGTCRNHLPVAPARVPFSLLKAATDMKVKCRNILPPLRGEPSVAQPGRGESELA